MEALPIHLRPVTRNRVRRFTYATTFLVGLASIGLAQELVYKEDFNTEGDGTRFTTRGRGFVLCGAHRIRA